MPAPLTQQARSVLRQAAREAARRGHSVVGTEHLLIALLHEPSPALTRVLAAMEVGTEAWLQTIEEGVPVGAERIDDTALRYGVRVRRALALASQERRAMGHEAAGPAHLLLGLYREEQGVAGTYVRDLPVSLADLRRLVERANTGVDRAAGPVPTPGAPPPPAETASSADSAPDPSPDAPPTRRRKNTPTLDRFGRDLTLRARQGELDPVVGRVDELRRLREILGRRRKNNPAIVGPPGVGKTALVEGLACELAREAERGPRQRLVALEMATLVAGTRYRGSLEDRLQRIVEEASGADDLWLFVDELHTLVGAGGGAGGALGAGQLLKPALERGDLQMIGATTREEYRRHVEPDGALSRRFQPLPLSEPDTDRVQAILEGVRPLYESHHGLRFEAGALTAAVRLADRYLPSRPFPDKAIDLLDQAGARVRLERGREGLSGSPPPRDVRRTLARLQAEKIDAILDQQFERAAEIRDRESKLAADHQRPLPLDGPVGADAVARVVARQTGIPMPRLESSERDRVLALREALGERVLGQPDAVEAVSRSLLRRAAGFGGERPVGAFLFVGPTGVGKTETARALAEQLFGTTEAMLRFDMSEFMEAHAASRLIGAPPGYRGYGDGGVLVEGLRRRPYTVVLFDEIEKAHPDVLHLLLQLLDDGRITGSGGRVADATQAVVILTSNLGTDAPARAGFARSDGRAVGDDRYREAVEGTLPPELLGRLDRVIPFRPLGPDVLESLARRELDRVLDRLEDGRETVRVADGAPAALARQARRAGGGARPLRRLVERQVADPLAERLLASGGRLRGPVLVKADGDSVTLTC